MFAAGSLANWADENKGKETLGKWRVLHWMSMPVGRWSIFVQTEIKSRSHEALKACNDGCSSNNTTTLQMIERFLIFLHSSLLMFLSLLPVAGKNFAAAKYLPLLPTVSSALYCADK